MSKLEELREKFSNLEEELENDRSKIGGHSRLDYYMEDLYYFLEYEQGSIEELKEVCQLERVEDIVTESVDATTSHQTILKIDGEYYGLDWWTNSWGDWEDGRPRLSEIYPVKQIEKTIKLWERV